MAFEIHASWWLIPAGITLAAFAWHWWAHRDEPDAQGYGAIGQGLGQALTLMVAAIVALVAWLVWALT